MHAFRLFVAWLVAVLTGGCPGCVFDSPGLYGIGAMDAMETSAMSDGGQASDALLEVEGMAADVPWETATDAPSETATDAPVIDQEAVIPDKPGTVDAKLITGHWYQADSAYCTSFCSKKSLTNAPGPEGSHCMSGEVRSASGIAQGIKFTYGCWPDCTGSSSYHQATATINGYCYMPGQTKDYDKTDRTVGCFCK